MYHYYPIHQTDHPLRGLCVVNKRFFFTPDGNYRTGDYFNRHGTRVTSLGNHYATIDFDQVYGHELGHGLGLPHDPEANQIMSSNYGVMSEFPQIRDQSRMQAKYGVRVMASNRLLRWIRWLRVASDRK